MKRIKVFIARLFLVGLCISSASFVLAPEPANSQILQGKLSEIKDKRLVFVDVQNETVKRQIEDFFRESNYFQVVQNLKDAEIIYAAGIAVESRPSFGTVENRRALPMLSSSERPGGIERKNEAQFYKNEYEYRRKTRALVYYQEPRGKRVTVWSNETLRINKSKEPGANLEFFKTSGDELSLAKRFVKAVKSLK